MARPMIGSASGKPSQAPTALSTTARLVYPSVRACSPSATFVYYSAADHDVKRLLDQALFHAEHLDLPDQ